MNYSRTHFDGFLKEKQGKTCFDHKNAKSTPIELKFCTLYDCGTLSPDLSPKHTKSTKKLDFLNPQNFRKMSAANPRITKIPLDHSIELLLQTKRKTKMHAEPRNRYPQRVQHGTAAQTE